MIDSSLSNNTENLKPHTVPAELKQYRQWVLWRFETREEKQTKIPYQINGNLASSTDATTWATFDEAIKGLATDRFNGIGFVVTIYDPYAGIDLDHCRNAETGEIEPQKREYIKSFNSYAEITPSQTGVRIWIKAKLPEGSRKRNDILHVEIYSQGRFFTVTGQHLECTPTTIEKRQNELNQLYASVFPAAAFKENKSNGREHPIDVADSELLQKAMAAHNGAAFTRLWNGDTSEHENDDSRADLALCSMLAFWLGNDESRIDSLFRQSGLYREKWEREDYRKRTISTAIKGNSDVYNGSPYDSFKKGGYRGESLDAEAKPSNSVKGVKDGQETSKPKLTSDDIKRYLAESCGKWVYVRDIDNDLNIRESSDKHLRRQVIYQLVKDGLVERDSILDNKIRYINAYAGKISLSLDNLVGPLPIKFPFRIQDKVNLYPRNIAVVAGTQNAGKTAFLLNVARMNRDTFKIVYFSSEMAEQELTERLMNFDEGLEPWQKVDFRERSHDFADAIWPDDFNIVDYIELNENIYQIGGMLEAIYNRLKKGIAIVAIQKKEGQRYGRGQEFSAEKPRLYLSMDYNKLSIVKGKNWHSKIDNPNHQYINFKIVKGCEFIQQGNWNQAE